MKGRIRAGKPLFTEEEAERAKKELILESMGEIELDKTRGIHPGAGIHREGGEVPISVGGGMRGRRELERIIEEDIV